MGLIAKGATRNGANQRRSAPCACVKKRGRLPRRRALSPNQIAARGGRQPKLLGELKVLLPCCPWSERQGVIESSVSAS
jgi:hypothetical protein